jgi:outer membrane protein assembly factor BamB
MNLKKRVPLAIIVACIHSVILASCEQFAISNPAASTPVVASRQVTYSNLDLVEKWRITTGKNGYTDFPPPLLIANGKAILGYPDESRNSSWLIAVSLSDGQIAWKTHIKSVGEYGTDIGENYHDSERLYLISKYRVSAYRLDDGQFLWRTPNLGERVGYNFRSWDGETPLRVYTTRKEVILINPFSGEMLSREPYPYYMQYGKYDFLHNWETSELSVMKRESNEILWQRTIGWTALMQPGFITDTMIFLDGNVYYQINRVALETGKTLWQTPGSLYVSNYALSDSRVYAIRLNGELVALDVETGQEIGEMVFGPAAPAKPGEYPYWVAAEDGYVLAYFGDSQELIALKMK